MSDAPASEDFYDEAPAPKKKRTQHEWNAQKVDNAFLSKALPYDAYYTAIDHASKSTPEAGKRRKDRGVKPGIPDWLIIYRGITLWIERKAGSGLSGFQKQTKAALEANGHQWRLAKSTEDVEWACRDVGIPLRATLGAINTRIAEQNERIKPRRKKVSKKPMERKVSKSAHARINAARLGL